MLKFKYTMGIILFLGNLTGVAVALKHLLNTPNLFYVCLLSIFLLGSFVMYKYVDSFKGVFCD